MTPTPKMRPTLALQNKVLMLTGSVTFDTVMDLMQTGLTLFKTLEQIQIDFSGLTHCDSSILALCTAWLRNTNQQKKELLFQRMPPFMQDLVRVHELESIFPISTSTSES